MINFSRTKTKMVVECKICLKYFQTKKQCMDHEKTCKFNFTNRLAILTLPNTNQRIPCLICKTTYASRKTFNKHAKSFHGANNSLIKKNDLNMNNVLKHGNENVDHITKDYMLNILRDASFRCVCKNLIKIIYFNPLVRKNHNWGIIYRYHDDGALIFDYNVDKFVRKSSRKIIDKKFKNMITLLTPILLEIIDNDEKSEGFLNEFQKENLQKLRFYCDLNLSYESASFFDAIREIAFENKDIVMKTWNDLGYNAKYLSLNFSLPSAD